MADPRSHLEKMGRELKCPICLSLLNSSVSLSCNHVFCNSCIVKSMKSGSNCPVCKLPYHRREVRAAPHMDNLVNIYKSMEVASGLNIFVTQTEPLAKPTDKEGQIEGDLISSGDQVPGAIDQDRADNQRTTNRKRLRRTTESNVELLDPVSVKPSFPTKKRVQVAHYPLPETPIQPAKFDGGLISNTSDELKDGSIFSKGKSVLNEGPVLSPFFWLREEEDVEKSTQHSDGDTYITPPDVPTFSDMKDSDDKNSYELSPAVEMHGNLDGVDLFDSEMFEWTQRPCSPELLSSPVKMQVADTNKIAKKKLDTASQDANTNEELCNENAKCVTSEQGNRIVDEVQCKVSSFSNNTKNRTANGKLHKRGGRAKKNVTKKCAKKDADQDSELHVNSKEESYSAQKQTNDSNGGSIVLENSRKTNERVGSSICATEPGAENVVPVRAETVDKSAGKKVPQLPASLCKKQGIDEDLQLKNEKFCRKINSENKEGSYLRSKRRKVGSTKVNMPEKVVAVQNQTDEDTIQQPLFPAVCIDNDKKISAVKENHSKGAGKNKFAINSKCDDKPKCKKSTKVSFNGTSKDGLVDENQDGNVSMKETESTENAQGSADVRVLQDSSRGKKLLKTEGGVLQKCETLANKIQCAFCHSSEHSEASGEMLHYYNGRPVAANYNSGSKVIHSHRNCTEWAPNVYFEEDTAINLEAELARSRRIKCCCCGLKGAALGCYEKSCRRSFHVPCAKLTLQCHWDTDNFVILCPIHASSKLPNENSKPQPRESRKKSISKVQLQARCSQVATDIGTSCSWNSSQDKLVLCCSALTAEEQGIISQFERLSKVAVLRKWDSRVTHVIASTDENGACKRTLKVFMAILEGKWILNIEWVKACMKAMKPVGEEQYEIVIDSSGIRDGPRLGRLRVLNEQPKLFDGLKFYLMGGFESSYKGYLQDLVIAAGGTILHRKPISRDHGALLSDSSSLSTFIIYNLELPEKCDLNKRNMFLDSRKSDAQVLANSTGAKAVSNLWVLNSIAACKLQNYVD